MYNLIIKEIMKYTIQLLNTQATHTKYTYS